MQRRCSSTWEIPTEETRNGGNDAVSEVQSSIAGECLITEQRQNLIEGQKMHPQFPAIWIKGGESVADTPQEESLATSTHQSKDKAHVVSQASTSPEEEAFPAIKVANILQAPVITEESHESITTPTTSTEAHIAESLVSSPASAAMWAKFRK